MTTFLRPAVPTYAKHPLSLRGPRVSKHGGTGFILNQEFVTTQLSEWNFIPLDVKLNVPTVCDLRLTRHAKNILAYSWQRELYLCNNELENPVKKHGLICNMGLIHFVVFVILLKRKKNVRKTVFQKSVGYFGMSFFKTKQNKTNTTADWVTAPLLSFKACL